MADGGSLDEKIITIPFGDPTYNAYYDIQEMPKHVFEVYKSLGTSKRQSKRFAIEMRQWKLL